METFSPNIVTAALAAATIAKILVDLVRATQKLPAWASPILALTFAQVAAFLLLLSTTAALTPQMAAQTAIAGILAASTAVGSTELQKREKQGATAFAGELLELQAEAPAAPEHRP